MKCSHIPCPGICYAERELAFKSYAEKELAFCLGSFIFKNEFFIHTHKVHIDSAIDM